MTNIPIFQGDMLHIPFVLVDEDENYVTEDGVTELEVTVGSSIRKLKSSSGDDQVTFVAGATPSEGRWYFWLTQTDTITLQPGPYEVQCRPKLVDRTIPPVLLGKIMVAKGNSKEILSD